jgi:multidrug transporter EmrE-like cation transporter
MAYLFLSIAFTLNAAANILLKLGSVRGLDLTPPSLFRLLSNNWELLAGVVLFALNIVFYYLALRGLPLSISYPVMVTMGFIIVNGYAFFALHESVTALSVVGYALMVIGLIMVIARPV